MEATIIASLPYLNIVHLHPQILHISIAHVIYIKQLQYLQPCYIYQHTITAKNYFFNNRDGVLYQKINIQIKLPNVTKTRREIMYRYRSCIIFWNTIKQSWLSIIYMKTKRIHTSIAIIYQKVYRRGAYDTKMCCIHSQLWCQDTWYIE